MTDRPDLATCEVAFRRVFAAIDAGRDQRRPWLEQVREGLGAVVELFAAEPALARTAAVDALAGPETRRLYGDAILRLARCLDPGRELAVGARPPESVSPMSAGAVAGLISDEVLAGRATELPARLPDLLFTLLVPFLGPEAAAAEMRRAPAQRGM